MCKSQVPQGSTAQIVQIVRYIIRTRALSYVQAHLSASLSEEWSEMIATRKVRDS